MGGAFHFRDSSTHLPFGHALAMLCARPEERPKALSSEENDIQAQPQGT